MSSNRKTIDERMNQLPPQSRANVLSFLDYLFERNGNEPGFLEDLEIACQRTFERYEQTAYANWQELQQDLLLRFLRWLPSYRGKADRRTILTRIAANLLIEAARGEQARLRCLESVDLNEPTTRVAPANIYQLSSHRRTTPERSGRKLRQSWAGALRDHREEYSS